MFVDRIHFQQSGCEDEITAVCTFDSVLVLEIGLF